MTKLLSVAAILMATGCESASQAAGSASAAASGAAPAKTEGKAGDGKAGDGKAEPAKGPTTKLVKKDVDDLMTKTFGFERMKEPIDKRTAEVVEKLGKPAKVDGDSNTWYALDENKACHEVTLDMKSGAYSSGGTDKAKCGL